MAKKTASATAFKTGAVQETTLTTQEQTMFNVWVTKNPGKTVNDWQLARQAALQKKPITAFAVVAINGFVAFSPTDQDKRALEEEIKDINSLE